MRCLAGEQGLAASTVRYYLDEARGFLAGREDRLAAALSVSEDQVERAEPGQQVQCVPVPQVNVLWPGALSGQGRGLRVFLDRGHCDVGPGEQRGDDPGGSRPGAGAER